MKRVFGLKKGIIISLCVLTLALLVAFFTCPAYKTVRALKNGNKAVVEQQLSKVDDPLQDKLLVWMLPSAMEKINNSYNDGKMSFDNAEGLYKVVLSAETIDVSNYHNDFKALAESKQNYDNAESAMNAQNYPAAIGYYKNVISADRLYDAAQEKLENAANRYKNNIADRFYAFILSGDMDSAETLINEAANAVSDYDLRQKQEKLSSGVYEKIYEMLEHSDDWEIITQSHAGENTYCCYRIKAAKTDSDAFECYYVIQSLNSLVQSGQVSSIGGPVAWYEYWNFTEFEDSPIRKVNYSKEKQLESGGYDGTVSWDYTLSKLEKLKKLEELFS